MLLDFMLALLKQNVFFGAVIYRTFTFLNCLFIHTHFLLFGALIGAGQMREKFLLVVFYILAKFAGASTLRQKQTTRFTRFAFSQNRDNIEY
jgi:hypothetical protein